MPRPASKGPKCGVKKEKLKAQIQWIEWTEWIQAWVYLGSLGLKLANRGPRQGSSRLEAGKRQARRVAPGAWPSGS